MMYIASVKFEKHCFNISRVILDRMLCCLIPGIAIYLYAKLYYSKKKEINYK